MIGYVQKAVDYFQDNRPKKAQSVPASLFWREEGLGIHYGDKKLTHMPFNLFISEKHSLKFSVSDHPLQDGSTISDHVHRELREVTVEGMFTNHPMKKMQDVNEVKFKDEYATSEVKATVSNTALANFEKLKLLANERKPVRLVCSLEVYPKMVITAIDYERDSKSGSSIRFTMTLREIQTVQFNTATGTYSFQPEDMTSANDKLIAAEKNAGNRAAEEATANQLREIHNMEMFS